MKLTVLRYNRTDNELDFYIDAVRYLATNVSPFKYEKFMQIMKHSQGRALAWLKKKVGEKNIERVAKMDKIAAELVKVAKLVLGDVDKSALRKVADGLGKAFKTTFKVNMNVPDVKGIVYTDNRTAQRKFKKDYESPRGYVLVFDMDDGSMKVELNHGKPNFGSTTRISMGEFRKGQENAIVKWAVKIIKADLKKRYNWDEEPKKKV